MSPMTGSKFHPYIDSYLEEMENGVQSQEIHAAAGYVRRKLDNDYVRIDGAKIDRAVELMEKYFAMTLFPWERFVVAAGSLLRRPQRHGHLR